MIFTIGLWKKNILTEMGIEANLSISSYHGNKAAPNIAYNPST